MTSNGWPAKVDRKPAATPETNAAASAPPPPFFFSFMMVSLFESHGMNETVGTTKEGLPAARSRKVAVVEMNVA